MILANTAALEPLRLSVHANQLVFDNEPGRLERFARYLTRTPLGLNAVRANDDGPVSR